MHRDDQGLSHCIPLANFLDLAVLLLTVQNSESYAKLVTSVGRLVSSLRSISIKPWTYGSYCVARSAFAQFDLEGRKAEILTTAAFQSFGCPPSDPPLRKRKVAFEPAPAA